MSNPSPSKRRKTNDAKGLSTIRPSSKTASPAKIIESPSKNTMEDPEDWTSSSGSDSDSDSASDAASITISTKPPQSSTPTTNNTIHTRLTSFFSQLAEQRANPESATDQSVEKIEIDSDSDSGFEDEGEERGGQYIELDLALGVLSEKESDEEQGSRGTKVKLPGRKGDEESDESGSDVQCGDDSELGGLDGLIAIGDATSKRKARKKGEEKRKIQEVE